MPTKRIKAALGAAFAVIYGEIALYLSNVVQT